MTSELPLALREKIENTIRNLAIDAVERAGSGHPGAPMGLARPAFEIWANHLRFDPADPDWPLRDRFVLSAGHASMLLYALLHLFEYKLSLDDLKKFRQIDSKTPGHPEYGDTPGVEVTTGPLGQGFGHGVGMALAGRLARSRYGRGSAGPGHHHVYGIVSDGDLMEGISYESASLAGHLGLGNLIYVYDDNRITIDGGTEISFGEDVACRFEAQRWHVQSVDGQDTQGLADALVAARREEDRPSIIMARTTIGFGSPNRAGKSKAHGEALGEEEARLTKDALGWPSDATFVVPDDVRAALKEIVAQKRAARRDSDAELSRWRDAEPELSNAWDAAREQRLPDNLGDLLCDGLEGVDDATRKHSGAVIQKLPEHAPFLVGGSADLAGSNNTSIKSAGDVGPAAGSGNDPFAGRNLHFGVREHAMGAVLNGLSPYGTFRGYGGTFLVFSDYVRPAIRLAALMNVPTVFVFTHDSIFLGEDGPTHQPIEHLDALRAIPNLTLFRPADGIETAMAWAWALQKARGPVVLALTRQKVVAPNRPTGFQNTDVLRGAYTVREPDGKPDVVLIASGSELPTASGASQELARDGVAARVISAPCLELLAAQDDGYRSSLFPDGVPVIAVEAGLGEAFRPYVGSGGLICGIDRFGASAPFAELSERFGFTASAIAAKVRQRLSG
jgi:transketolase